METQNNTFKDGSIPHHTLMKGMAKIQSIIPYALKVQDKAQSSTMNEKLNRISAFKENAIIYLAKLHLLGYVCNETCYFVNINIETSLNHTSSH